MAVTKFKTCLPLKQFKALGRISKKYYQGNRAAALVDAVTLLDKAYRRAKQMDGRRFAAIADDTLGKVGKNESSKK